MAGEVQDQNWPLPNFHFQVTWGETILSFQEVSGLNTDTQPIEYRHSNSKIFSTIKMPGLQQFNDITMKKGVFVTDNTYWDWYSQITMNTIERITVVIQLLDQEADPKITWTLNNAWPKQIMGPDLNSQANDVAIQSIEVAHEGLVIAAL